MSLQAHDFSISGAPPPPGPSTSYSFSFERVISPPRRPPALPRTDLQPTKLWRCSLDALAKTHEAAAGPSQSPPRTLANRVRLPSLQPAVAAKIDPIEQILGITPRPAAVATPKPLDAGNVLLPDSTAGLELLSSAPPGGRLHGPSIRPHPAVLVSEPAGLCEPQPSQVRFAETPLLSKDWPVIGGGGSLAPAPLLEWQIERNRERARDERKPTPPVKSVILPDRPAEPDPGATKKSAAAPIRITKGMTRWLAAAASLAIAAFGATRFGASAIDSLNQVLEPRAAFVFFDDPSTGAGPWWPAGNFSETADRTFTVAGLALNRATIGRGDLRFDFEVKASSGFGWVAGAKDENNYLAYRLAVNGRRKKEYVLLRYPVVDGKPDPDQRDEFPVSADLFEDEFNKFSVRVHQDRLTVLINGQGVDYWTNPAAARGGVGFFAEKGDNPSIRSVRVDGNDDFTGLMARGTIDTLKGVREMLAGESEARGSVAGGEAGAAGPSD